MEKPLTEGDGLWWKMTAKRSRRRHLLQPTADESCAADSLLLLANSGGGFCNSPPFDAVPITIFPPKKHTPSHSAAADVEKPYEAASPDTTLLNGVIHVCWTCGKAFQSHQALGGHMTSHRAKIENAAAATAAESGRVHECYLCHEKFASGWALGGHMRKHREGPSLPREATSSGGESSGSADTH